MGNLEALLMRAVGYVVAALVLAGVLWWAGDKVLDAIRAPVVAELDRTVKANESLVKANESLAQANTRLDKLLTKRSATEQRIDQRLKRVEGTLKALKAANPAVRDWADTPIPVEVLQ